MAQTPEPAPGITNRIKALGLALGLLLLNLAPLAVYRWVSFNPLFLWRKGPFSFEKPGYPPAGTESFALLLAVLLLDLYLAAAWLLSRPALQGRHPRLKGLGLWGNLAFVLLFFAVLEAGTSWYIRQHLLTPFRPHARLFWTLQPNLRQFYNATGNYHITTNAQGFRGSRNLEREKPPGTIRILTLGDSGPFGHGVEEADSYQAQLQRRLRQDYPRSAIEVINACVPGWTTRQALTFLHTRGAALQPDIVILGFNNDSTFDYCTDRQRQLNPRMAGVSELLYRSELYLLLKKVLGNSRITWSSRGETPAPPPQADRSLVRRVPRTEFNALLSDLAQWCREHQARLILVNNPIDLAEYYRIDPSKPSESVRVGSIDFTYREDLKRFAREQALPLLNAHDIWAQHNYHSFFLPGDYSHPNARGQRWLADALAELIIGERWLPATNPAP